MQGANGELWGKERVIAALMRAQRDSGDVVPRLVTFAPSALGALLSDQGFEVEALERRDRTVPLGAVLALRRSLINATGIVHTHGYKANIVGRLARAAGAPMRALVSTCHGWVDESTRTRLYNRIDRATAPASDVVTVTDRAMLARIPSGVRAHYVANGIEDRAPASPSARTDARARFRFPADRLIVGTLGRIERSKGALDVLEAARRTADAPVQWILAGGGTLETEIRSAGLPNVTVLDYVDESDRYLDAIDVYLQASHAEGLSLALLEAMRAALAIVATRAGSTEDAVRSHLEALLIAPGDVDALVGAVRRLIEERDLAPRLGSAARERFERSFRLESQHRAFLSVYASCDRMRS